MIIWISWMFTLVDVSWKLANNNLVSLTLISPPPPPTPLHLCLVYSCSAPLLNWLHGGRRILTDKWIPFRKEQLCIWLKVCWQKKHKKSKHSPAHFQTWKIWHTFMTPTPPHQTPPVALKNGSKPFIQTGMHIMKSQSRPTWYVFYLNSTR